MSEKPPNNIAYVGLPGSGLGWRLSGIDVYALDQGGSLRSAGLRQLLRELVDRKQYQIVFVDEELALGRLKDIARLNEDALPAIILLPNASQPLNLTRTQMEDLVVKAVGSNIFNSHN